MELQKKKARSKVLCGGASKYLGGGPQQCHLSIRRPPHISWKWKPSIKAQLYTIVSSLVPYEACQKEKANWRKTFCLFTKAIAKLSQSQGKCTRREAKNNIKSHCSEETSPSYILYILNLVLTCIISMVDREDLKICLSFGFWNMPKNMPFERTFEGDFEICTLQVSMPNYMVASNSGLASCLLLINFVLPWRSGCAC